MTMTTFLIEACGWIGASLILGGYILLSLGRLKGDSPAYQWMNVIGAAGFIINSGYHGAIPSTVINVIWIAMGAYAFWRIYRVARPQ